MLQPNAAPRIGETGVDITPPFEPPRSKLNRRNRRKFEQKAAKETKAQWGLGFRDDHSLGLRPICGTRPRSASRKDDEDERRGAEVPTG
jgi:hypothetical protein